MRGATLRVRSARLHVAAATLLLCAVGLPAQTPAPRTPPKAARQALNRAEEAEGKKRIPEARQYYESAVALYPDYAEAWCGLGLLQAEQDEFAAAMRSFRRALASDPKQICPYLPLAMLEHGAKDWPALLEVTDRMLRLDSIDYPLAHLLNAVAHYNLGDYDEAAKAARAAEALDNRSFPEIWGLLGWVEARRGNDAAAAEQFQKYLKAAPMGQGADLIREKLSLLAARLPHVPLASALTPTFSVDADLVLVQFEVVPRRGRSAPQLTPGDIEIREGGVLQHVAILENAREDRSTVPIEISLLFDCSGSVTSAGALDPYVFQETIFDEYPNISIAIYAFSDKLTRLTKPTRDARVLKKAMDAVLTVPSSNTRLFGAIANAAQEAADGRSGVARKMLIFSDGVSNSADQSDMKLRSDAASTARRLGVPLYPVLLDTPDAVESPRSGYVVDSVGPSLRSFAGLGAATAGRAFLHIKPATALHEVLKFLSDDVLPNTYVAGYYPASPGQDKPHEVQVVLRDRSKGELTGGSRIVVH